MLGGQGALGLPMGLVGRWKLCRGQCGLSGKPLMLFPEAMLKPRQLMGEVFDTFPTVNNFYPVQSVSQGGKSLSPCGHVSVHLQSY